MQIREIETTVGFEALRSDWNAAFAADAHSGPFMSWAWHRGWIDVTPHPWMVLAARDSEHAPFTAFLPISLRGSRSALRIDHLREVHAGGEPTADEAGFVCDPRTESRDIEAIARHLVDNVTWDRLRFEELNDPRMPAFLAHMPDAFEIVEHRGTPCPHMPLPATWEAFMAGLSSSTRQSLRKRMKVAEREFRVTVARGSEISEGMIDALIQMAVRRTRIETDPHAWRLHSMLRRCALAGSARMIMLWKDQTPIAGVASLIDSKRNAACLYVTSFDEAYSEFSPGRVAVALAIRDAIECGMSIFDFLRGEEPYKFQFGAESRHNRTLIIERPTLQAALRRKIIGVRDTLRI